MTIAIPTGAYLGNPNGTDALEEAKFETLYNGLTSTLGMAPTLITSFVDYAKPISNWIDNARYQAGCNAQSPVAQGLTPVIGLPMYSTDASASSPDATFKDFASGKLDGVIQGVVKAWADNGFKTQYWRPGWEMNLPGTPYYAGSDPATQADWVAAFQHIYTVLHQAAVANGVALQVVWNPGITNYTDASATTALYPGSQHVDIIGADIYSDVAPYGDLTKLYDWSKNGQMLNAPNPVYSPLQQWAADPVNLTHYYTNPASTQYALDGSVGHALSLQNLIDFAKSQGKPFAVPETGAGSTNDGAGVSDNPTFVAWLHSTLANAGVPISFVNIWDSNGGGNYEFSQASDAKPLEAAAWRTYFGAGSSAAQSLPVGPGPDKLVLTLSEDAFKGDAQVAVYVDGVQVGDVQTITAAHGSGLGQTLTTTGNWGAGTHIVGVDFLNDAYVPGVGDRNLYVNSAVYDGQVAPGAALTLLSAGTQTFSVGTPAQSLSVSPPVAVGAGPDVIDLKISEDAYQGDAQFTITVDGVVVGGSQTAHAVHSLNADQDFFVSGKWGGGPHTVGVNFLNDAYGGSASLDRNLYLDGATYNGLSAPAAALALYRNGPQSVTVGGPDTITLGISEDNWLGDAQYTVAVDGVQVGGVRTATASHSAGQSQSVDLAGAWGLGAHTVAIDFINDAWGGTAATDRNLYVTGASFDGAAQTDAARTLFSNGSASVQVVSATTYHEGDAGGSVTTLGNDTVTIGTGAVSITEQGLSLKVIGGLGRMTFAGGAGSATITAGAGDVAVTGGSGALAFAAGIGNAVVTAGTGTEIFGITAGTAGGSLMISNFVAGRDVLNLTGYAGSGVASQKVSSGTTVLLLTDKTTITLTGFVADATHPVFG